MCWTFYYLSQENENDLQKKFIRYIEYIYMQSCYLSRMLKSNMEAEQLILSKHKYHANGVYETPGYKMDRFLTIDKCHTLQK